MVSCMYKSYLYVSIILKLTMQENRTHHGRVFVLPYPKLVLLIRLRGSV